MILYFVIYSNCIQTTDNLHWDAFRALRITAPPPMSAYIRGRQRGGAAEQRVCTHVWQARARLMMGRAWRTPAGRHSSTSDCQEPVRM